MSRVEDDVKTGDAARTLQPEGLLKAQFQVQSVDLGPTTDTDLHVEAGAQLRAFLASNVALSAALGLGIENGDDNADPDIEFLSGQLVGNLGITYFFF